MRHSDRMPVYRNALVLALLLGLGSAALSQSPPSAPPAPLRVTTDTPEYCNNLAGRIAAEQRTHATAPPEVQMLAQEGQHMCDTGLIRGGLVRLRRALLMLESQK
jgi:hypothetical protein